MREESKKDGGDIGSKQQAVSGRQPWSHSREQQVLEQEDGELQGDIPTEHCKDSPVVHTL